MEFYEVINNRKTIREFENEPIPTNIIEKIIAAAFKAPTNDHMRNWHYIIVKNRKIVAKLLDIIPKEISDEDMVAERNIFSILHQIETKLLRCEILSGCRISVFCLSKGIIIADASNSILYCFEATFR